VSNTFLAAQALAMLTKAAECQYGGRFKINFPEDTSPVAPALRAKQILYRFRKELGNPTFLNMQVRLCPDDPTNKIWIINKNAPVPDEHDLDPEAPVGLVDSLDIGF